MEDIYFEERCDILRCLVNKLNIDLNKISRDKLLIDIYPEYRGPHWCWKIGVFLQRARKNNHQDYFDVLRELGFTFQPYVGSPISKKEKLRENVRFKQKCKILTFLVKVKGLDLNNFLGYETLTDVYPEYNGSHYNWLIGKFLTDASAGKHEEYHELLTELGFNFSLIKVTISRNQQQYERRCKILQDLVSMGVDINRIPARTTLSHIYPNYEGEEKDWEIGKFISNARCGRYLAYNEFLESLGFKFERLRQSKHKKTDTITPN